MDGLVTVEQSWLLLGGEGGEGGCLNEGAPKIAATPSDGQNNRKGEKEIELVIFELLRRSVQGGHT